MTKNAYNRRRVMVIPCACDRRNSDHEGPARRGEGAMPALRRIFQMVEAPIW